MIRPAVLLALTLTLGAGNSAVLVCQTACDRAIPAESADRCTHNGPANTRSIASDAACTSVDSTPTVAAEQYRTAPPAPGASTAAALPAHPPATRATAVLEISAPLPLGDRCRNPILRI